MPRKKSVKKTPTEFTLDCPCGEKAVIFALERGYMGHCVNCGSIVFFDNPALLERLRFGGQLCSHHPKPKPCRGGHTTFCKVCRVRSFYYNMRGEE